MNLTIHPNSRISRLPKAVRFIAVVVRELRPRRKFMHSFDGIGSNHNFGFLNEDRFKYALLKANEAGARDYSIYLRLHQAIWCADVARLISQTASFVELGTGRGYIMSGVLGSLEFIDPSLHQKQEIYCFDTFLPFSTDLIGKQDEKFGTNPYYAESYESIQNTFIRTKNVHLIKGTLPESLLEQTIDEISFLHIDLNAPEIEIQCLGVLWSKILPGGIVLIDDYAYQGYDFTYMAFNKFAAEAGVNILTTASGQGIIIKPTINANKG